MSLLVLDRSHTFSHMFETKLFVCKLIQKRSGLTDEKATPTHTDTKNENHLMDVHQVSSRDDFKGPSKNYVTARGGRDRRFCYTSLRIPVVEIRKICVTGEKKTRDFFHFWHIFEPFRSHLGNIMTLIVT